MHFHHFLGRRTIDIEPLLKQHVPECYIKLQDIIRDVASRYAKENKHPVLSRAEIRYAYCTASTCYFMYTYMYMILFFLVLRQIASNGNFPGNLDELEQGIQFLHENGRQLFPCYCYTVGVFDLCKLSLSLSLCTCRYSPALR